MWEQTPLERLLKYIKFLQDCGLLEETLRSFAEEYDIKTIDELNERLDTEIYYLIQMAKEG